MSKAPKKSHSSKPTPTKQADASKHKPSQPHNKFSLKALAICILMACWVGLCIIISQVVIYYLFAYLITSPEQLEMPLYSALYSAIMYLVASVMIVLIPWLIFKKWRPSRRELGLSGAPTWVDILLAPAGLILYLLLAALFVIVFQLIFPWFNAEEAQSVGFDNLTTNFDLLLGFIALVIIAPIAEEFIFRGWLYGKIRRRLNLPLSILIVSALFGLMHGQWNVGINVFAMSIILCLQRELTGTIYSGILLHIIKNAIAFYLLYIHF